MATVLSRGCQKKQPASHMLTCSTQVATCSTHKTSRNMRSLAYFVDFRTGIGSQHDDPTQQDPTQMQQRQFMHMLIRRHDRYANFHS